VKRTALSMLALLSITPALADGTPSTEYRKVGAWDIRIDTSLGNGCFIFATYPSNDVLRVGIDNSKATPTAYMDVGNPNWHSLVVGTPYKISFSFDNDDPFEWQGVAKSIGGDDKLLYFSFDNGKFMDALATHATLHVFYRGQLLSAMNLPGSQAALQTLVECQSRFPTAGSGTAVPAPDPFRQ
jgi:hypothetical protein